jgi:transposase-like protein
MLSSKRDRKAAKRFFKKALSSNHNQIPRVITVDKNPAYPPAIDELKNEKKLSKNIEIRQVKYLNNIVEQDHRSIKRIITTMLGFQSFRSASKTLKGIEAMNMVKKGQANNLNYSGLDEVKYINQLFGIIL